MPLVGANQGNGRGGLQWFVPKLVPLDLLFFRRIFCSLNRVYGSGSEEIPLPLFQRAILRLFRILGCQRMFDSSAYDLDKSGQVGWWEFVSCWREHNISITLNKSERVYISFEDPSSCACGRFISVILMILITISSISFMAASLVSLRVQPDGCPECEPKQSPIFDTLEAIAIAVFSLEYIVRFIAVIETRQEILSEDRIVEMITDELLIKEANRFHRVVSFVVQPANVIDLAAILPFYVEHAVGSQGGSNSAVLRIVRLTRLFRLLKLGRYFEVLQMMLRVIRMSTVALYVLIFYLMLGVCFSSSLMYFAEGGEWDPKVGEYVRTLADGSTEPTPFKSIPGSFWWCIVTYTTVGYGDVYPITLSGKLVGVVTMLIGVLVVAMPISVVSSNFHQVWGEHYEEKKMEAEAREQEQQLLSEALLSQCPPCQRLTVEIWDYNGIGRTDDFLGEAHFTLPTDELEPVDKQETLTLSDNFAKGNPQRKGEVSGNVTVKYLWEPDHEHIQQSSPSYRKSSTNGQTYRSIYGKLTLTIVGAKDLVNADAARLFAGVSDPYAIFELYPLPPDKGGVLMPETCRTPTIRECLNPCWGHTDTFSYCWPKEQVLIASRPGKISYRSRQSIISQKEDSAPAGPLWKQRASQLENRRSLLPMSDLHDSQKLIKDETQLVQLSELQQQSASVLEALEENLLTAEKTSAQAMSELEAQAKQLSELQSSLLELYSEAAKQEHDQIRYYEWENGSRPCGPPPLRPFAPPGR